MSIWAWVGFIGFVLVMLAIDLGIFHKQAHVIGFREATIWSIVWVVLSLVFGVGIYLVAGSEHALEYLTGYLIEKSLSVDNLFVFVAIFSYLGIPARYQHRVLFWGILGALIMRGGFVALGAALINRFDWVMYIFGALLVLTGVRIAIRREESFAAEENRAVRFAQSLMPVARGFVGFHFFVHEDGRWKATPLLLALVLIELSDIMFAVDSIPAIFGVTREPYIVFTATVMALLGLRAMYFLLAGMLDRFRHLHFGLAAVLVFVGLKMLAEPWVHVPIWFSLGFILVAILLSGYTSWRAERRAEELGQAHPRDTRTRVG
ncbi:MAG TPA: TerC family protein [Longimicrobiales bacterium]|nr:TerC family protein [Longimicrobiales bacterium]